jgi:tRNA (adenine22-N1)-methyltransferase
MLPIFMIESGKAKKAVAVELADGPYNNSKRSINNKKLSDKIELRKGDGFAPLKAFECECAVIAGIGGILIIDILNCFPEKTKSFKQLVLVPILNCDRVRKALHNLGFEIEKEQLVFENNKYYNIISAASNIKSEPAYSEQEYIIGRKLLEKKDAYLRNWLEKEIISLKKLIAVLDNLPPNELIKAKRYKVAEKLSLLANVFD